MSGGRFDYVQWRIVDAADLVNSETEQSDFDAKTLAKFKECERVLRTAAAMLIRVDYLLSGDDSEESFHKRWIEDMEQVQNG